MADRHILYRIRAALQGGKVAVAQEVELEQTYPGVLTGVTDVESGLRRLDGTGVGASIFTFTGSYSAQASNISEWFGDRQQTRLRCTDNGGISPVIFTLPGATALNTAFDDLVNLGLPEVLRFVIEYTGPNTTFLRAIPRPGVGNPVISGTSAIIVRTGIAATVEVTRTNSVLSDYVFQSIGVISDTAGGTLNSIKLINPSTQIWDASSTGVLPSSDVVKGNAYRVANAPSDGSGRFGEVMQNLDWVVWNGETFTSWASEPHAWFVLPAHDVRRLTALGQEFTNDIETTPVSDRNSVIRGTNYADSVAEIRMKIYPTADDYDAADLNTTGDIDEYSDPANQTGKLAIRLPGTQASIADTLPTLYVFSEDGSSNFVKIFNLSRDFAHQGDFGAESDYLSIDDISYEAGTTLRIYISEDIDRFTAQNLDIFENNLSDSLQGRINRREAWSSIADVFFSGAVVRDVHVADRVDYTEGYSHGVDWRDMAESTTINDNRYLDSELSISVNLAAFTIIGFGNTRQKLIGIKLQRNDGNNGDGAMIEMGASSALIRINTSNEIQVNTRVGSGSPVWASLTDEAGAVTLSNTGDNFFMFEMVPIEGSPNGAWELVGEFYDGTNYHELNNIDFIPSGNANGDNLGFSRSVNQRGQILEFRAINSPGYLFHSQLDSLLRHHQDDKWDFGFARLFEGSDDKEVELQTLIMTPNTVVGTAAPTVTPKMVGDTFIDTVNKKVYRAIGTGDSGDWEVLN